MDDKVLGESVLTLFHYRIHDPEITTDGSPAYVSVQIGTNRALTAEEYKEIHESGWAWKTANIMQLDDDHVEPISIEEYEANAAQD